MLGNLLLPPGYRVEIALSGEQPPLDATITVLEGERWIGATTASTSRLDAPGQLQLIVDHLTKRGVRASAK